DLDAVGGYRSINGLSDSRKQSISRATSPTHFKPPPTPPPNQPLPPTPSAPYSPPSTPIHGTPMSSSLRTTNSRMDLRGGSDGASTPTPDPTLEIQKLQKKITTMETEKTQYNQLVETLEASLNDTEENLKVAKQQLQYLQREKADLLNQTKSLKTQLEEMAIQFEDTKNSVQEEKK
ncbi:17690_t:CDS:1, partial [Acaulospora morrowiae]